MPQTSSTPLAVAPAIPVQSGVGLAAVILGGLCVPLSVYIGVQSLAAPLPMFGVWYFLPIVVGAIALGMFASRTAGGVAGAVLGVAALLICMGFIVVDRLYGPDLRSQLTRSAGAVTSGPPAGLDPEQLLRAVRGATTQPGR